MVDRRGPTPTGPRMCQAVSVQMRADDAVYEVKGDGGNAVAVV